MGGKENLSIAEQWLAEFEKNLRDNIEHSNASFDISNSIAGKAQIVHKVMFEKATSQLFMFLRGFRKENFDNQDVIDAFCTSYEKYKENNSEPFVKLVIKEELNNIKKNFHESKFVQTINKKFGANNVFEVKWLEPKSNIKLQYKPIIEKDAQDMNILQVEDFDKNISVSEISSFQIFNNTFVRVRQDVSKSSESKAVVHYDCENTLVTKIKKIFDELFALDVCKKYRF